MKRVLVTGATGFIGRELVTHLLGHGHVVVAACRRKEGLSAAGLANVEWTSLELERADDLDPRALAGVECVFHLAARVHVMRSSAHDEERFSALNTSATATLAKRAAAAGVRRFVYLSSIKVNGEQTSTRPFSAADEPNPQDAYGRSKHGAERAIAEIARATGLEAVIVRPPLVYGPGVSANFRRLLSLARSGVPLPLASIRNKRSLISLWNLVEFLRRAGSVPRAAGRTLLISDGDDMSTPELLYLMRAAMKKPAHLWPMPLPALRTAAAAVGLRGEAMRLLDSLQVDIAGTCDVLDWRPSVAVNEGIARTAAWYMEQCDALR
jgi:nucleoside-diphosphate-sugar epimerase